MPAQGEALDQRQDGEEDRAEGGRAQDGRPQHLGVLADRAATRGAEVLWATILCTAALGAVFLAVLSLIERLALRWHVSQRTRARTRVT